MPVRVVMHQHYGDEDDREFRADRLIGLFDSPLNKLAHHIREASGYFVVRPDDPASCLRWIQDVFHVDGSAWPVERWFAIARLLPALHRLAGRDDAVALAFDLVFGLPVAGLRVLFRDAELDDSARTRLGERNARLGVDTVAAGRCRIEAGVEIHFGPVDLATYLEHDRPAYRSERDALYHLLLPSHLERGVTERWTVGDPSRGVRLADPVNPPTLGINAYLGAAAVTAQDGRST